MRQQLEVRIVVLHIPVMQFKLGMVDPKSDRCEWLGIHPRRDVDRIVGGLKESSERAGNIVTVSERWE